MIYRSYLTVPLKTPITTFFSFRFHLPHIKDLHVFWPRILLVIIIEHKVIGLLSEYRNESALNVAFSTFSLLSYIFIACQAKKRSFLRRIVTGNEKWTDYDNPERKKSSVSFGEPSTSTPKRNIHGLEV